MTAPFTSVPHEAERGNSGNAHQGASPVVWLVHGTRPDWLARRLLRFLVPAYSEEWQAAGHWRRKRLARVRWRYRRLWRWLERNAPWFMQHLPPFAKRRLAPAGRVFAWLREPQAAAGAEVYPIRSAIRATLGPTAVFKVLRWTGGNSHGERVHAGRRLAAAVQAEHDKSDGAPQYIVAHSHGGNVALYALRDPAIPPKVARLVTIATPFVSCAPRRLPKILGGVVWTLPLGALLLTLFTGVKLESSMPPGWRGLSTSVGLILGPLFMMLLTWFFSPGDRRAVRVAGSLRRAELAALARWSTDPRAAVSPDAVPPVSAPLVYCVRVGNDEAHAGIGVFSTAADLPFHFLPLVRRVVVAAAVWVLMAITWGVLLQLRLPPAVQTLTRGSGYVLGFWWAVLLVAFAASLLFRWLVFGAEGLWSALLIRITGEAVPDVRSKVLNDRCSPDELAIAARDVEATTGRRLTWHSAPCYSPAVADRIARWLASPAP